MMLKAAFAFAAALIAVGIGFYFGTNAPGYMALIPAIPGVLIGICALAALRDSWRKHAMHVSMVFALLGALAPLRQMFQGIKQWPARSAMTVEVWLMFVLCLAYLILGIRSFIVIRRNRNTAQAAPASDASE